MKFVGVNDPAFVAQVVEAHEEFWAKAPNKEKLARLEEGLQVELSKRLAVCAGKAWGRFCRISLNYRLLKDKPEELRDTYGHELAHLIAHELYGPRVGHGRPWKNIMVQLGLPPERCHNMDVSALRRPRKRHLYGCEKCPREFRLTTYKHKNAWRYKCRCGGHLENLNETIEL